MSGGDHRSVEPVYWNIRDIQFHFRLARSTAWRLVREIGFPAPVLYGSRHVVWPRAEVIDYLEAQRESDHYRRKADEQKKRPLSPPSTYSTRPVRTRSPR